MTKVTIKIKYPLETYKHTISVDAWDLSFDAMMDNLIKPLLRSVYGKAVDEEWD